MVVFVPRPTPLPFAATLVLAATLALVARPAAAQPADCAGMLGILESAAAEERASLWPGVEAVCETTYENWLQVHGSLAPETDVAVAVQVIDFARALVSAEGDCIRALTVLGEVAHAYEAIPAALVDAFARASHVAFVCEVPMVTPTVAVPTVSDEVLEFSGFSGGTHEASRFGMPCVGRVAESPNHVFDVETTRRVTVLGFAEEEAGDLSLIVTGPGGTWCRDDVYGRNPALSERMTPGRYAVFVGEAGAGERGTRYRLEVSANPLPPIVMGVQPRYAIMDYPIGRESFQLDGVAEGTLEARLLGPSCTGHISPIPDFRVEVAEAARVTIQASPAGRHDLTLVVLGEGSVHCSDDAMDHDPAVSTWLEAGIYDVWVGRKGEEEAPYSVRFSEDDLFGVEPGVLTPAFGTGSLSATRRTVRLAGVVTGEESATDRFGPLCTGYISFEPSHTLYVEQEGEVWLEASPGSLTPPGHPGADFETGDLTLIVTGPSGTFCSDDYRERDPGIVQYLTTGTYDVYVGERELTPVGTAYGLRATLDRPTEGIERPGDALTLEPGAPAWHGWGRTFGEVAGSEILGIECPGELGEHPVLRVTVPEATTLRVVAGAGLLGELVVAVDGADGEWCGGAGGTEARVEAVVEPGVYEVYVGEVFGTALGTPYALWVDGRPTWAAPTPTTGPSPRPTPPRVEPTVELTLDASFGMAGLPGASGGPVPARAFGATCTGHVPEAPQVAVEVTEPGLYRFAVVANGDTTLVVDGPGGPWCNDDAEGFNPVVEAMLTPGRYRVFVGSYSPRTQHDFAMFISYQRPGGP